MQEHRRHTVDTGQNTKPDDTGVFCNDLERLVAERTLRLAATINQLEREAAERRSVENRLALQGRFYQAILDRVVEGVFVTSRFDIITFANETLLSVIPGESSNQVMGKHVLLDFDPRDIIGSLVPFYLTAKGAVETVNFSTIAIVTIEGASRYYSGCVIPMLENGQYNGMICTIRDVTLEKEYHDTQKEIQTRLIQANKTNYLSFLVSGIDHEINNPTNSIMLGSELLSLYWNRICSFFDELDEQTAETPEHRTIFEDLKQNVPPVINGIKESVRRIEKVMTTLREVSGKNALAPTNEVDLNMTVSVSVAILHHHINKSTRHLVVDLADDIPRIPGNSPQIIQVVINLLMNALQATPDVNNVVTITTRYDRTGSRAHLSVHDEGGGIPADILNKVFDPFFTTRLKQGGAGLGLPISRHIINEHNGSLHLETVSGKGTRVLVTLPTLPGIATIQENLP